MPREEGGASNLDRRLREPVLANARQGADDGQSCVCFLRVLHLLDRMALNHVADLVPESSRQLVELLRAFDESAIDVDIAPWQSEGVHLFGVHDVEMPIQIRAAGGPGDGLAEILDVSSDGRIADDGKLRVDFLGVLPAERDFLVLRYRAGRKQGKKTEQKEGTNHSVAGIRVNSGGQDMFHSRLAEIHGN